MHKWTDEQISWLREQYRVLARVELRETFNAHFDCDISMVQLKGAMGNHKIRQYKRTGRFEAGQESWNTGKTGYMGANKTSFKKGHKPHNTRRLWSERISKDGYVEIKVLETNPHTGYPTRYRQKHVWLWEMAHGKKQRGSAIIFRDGDNRNFDLDNLMMVTRKELLVLNLHDYKNQPDEVKPSILALAKMEAKAGIRTRPGRGRQKK